MSETFPLNEHQRKVFSFRLNHGGRFFVDMAGGIVAKIGVGGFVRQVGCINEQGLCIYRPNSSENFQDAQNNKDAEVRGELKQTYDFVVGGRND